MIGIKVYLMKSVFNLLSNYASKFVICLMRSIELYATLYLLTGRSPGFNFFLELVIKNRKSSEIKVY